MGLFEMGVNDDSDGAGFVEYGPGDVRAKIAATDREMNAVNALVPGSKLPASRKTAWAGVFSKWVEFRHRTAGLSGSPSLMRDSTFRLAGDFAVMAAKVRGEIAGGGVRLPPAGPAMAPQKNLNGAGSPFLWEWQIPWKKILVVGGVAVGGYFLYRHFRKPPAPAEASPAPGPVFLAPPAAGYHGFVMGAP